ncbi:MAG: hypothetical protein K5657_03735, partial [Desulfovibrio sp.]|nr:hypothetical protein [Desulfovibrio sp.]
MSEQLQKNSIKMLEVENEMLSKAVHLACSGFIEEISSISSLQQLEQLADSQSQIPVDREEIEKNIETSNKSLNKITKLHSFFAQINIVSLKGDIISSSNINSIGSINV